MEHGEGGRPLKKYSGWSGITAQCGTFFPSFLLSFFPSLSHRPSFAPGFKPGAVFCLQNGFAPLRDKAVFGVSANALRINKASGYA
jgi:hypothetical protein